MNVFTMAEQDTVETIEGADHDDLDDAIERYSEKDGYFVVVDQLTYFGSVSVDRVRPVGNPVFLTEDEASVLYWALEKLDAEIGLNEEENPIFRKVAEHVDEPHGLDGVEG